jgi:hypothetical protein
MSFKQDFLEALTTGADHQALLDVVCRHQEKGLTPQEAYQTLEQVWLEFGFDETEAGGAMRDELEFVMEKAWYQGPKDGVKV